jgi:signal transduction histidine kinase
MTRSLLNLELKKVFQIMVGLVLFLLIVITALGAKQYFLYRHCREAVSLSHQLLFGFTSIKEHISETLLTGNKVDLQEISGEIQGFDEQINKIGDDILIPEEFKASFISQVDLVNLVVQLRAVQGNKEATPKQLSDLTSSLRSVSNRLLNFHEALSTYTQSLLLGLQRVMVGTLAMVVCIVSSMLFFMHRYISEPVLRLCRSVYNTLAEQDEEKPDSVHASIAILDRLVQETAKEKQRLRNLLNSIRNVRETIPDHKNDPEFWETLCQALQTNPDYLLVWVGLPAGKDEFPDPVTGCGCVSSSPVQCRQTINHLITFCRQEGSLCDTARKAAAGKEIVVESIPVNSMPDTLRSSLPFTKKRLLCASFPVMDDQNLCAVVTIYSTRTHCFAEIENKILHFFFQQIVSIPDQLQQDHSTGELTGAGVYRYSVIGALSAGIAHEMINTSNGVLNYSQALLDLMADKNSLEEERFLLEKLHQEELKNAGLTGELVKLTAKNNPKPEKINITSLFERAVQLLRGQLKENGIQIVIDAEDQLPAVTVASQPVLIILLSMLHHAAGHVIRKTERESRKVITAVIRTENNNDRLSLSIDNYPVTIENVEQKITDGAWPDMSTCTEMAQAVGGSFNTEIRKKGTTTCCTLSLPVA